MTLPRNPDLSTLLQALDADADLVQRHLWLIALLGWIRGPGRSSAESGARVQLLLDVLDARLAARARLQCWWQTLLSTVDATVLLSDFGLASRSAFVGEFVARLHRKVLPATPETADAAELFALMLPSAADADWIAALPQATLQRLAELLQGAHAGYWQETLLEAMDFCCSQIRATGFSPEIRLRLDLTARDAGAFHALAGDFDAFARAWRAGDALEDAAAQLRTRLEACRHSAASVYTHLDAHGISLDLVFRLRQLRERVLRVRALLDCLLHDADHQHAAQLLAHLVRLGQAQRSLGELVANTSSLLAAKVAERQSETGEHYITRNRSEYRAMLRAAAGGGALTALTTWAKFALLAFGLSAFWFGFWAGVNYALSFVLIQLFHFTLATKQPAMTAPAMAAKLKDLGSSRALEGFVDEVGHLVRSQVAAALGNVLLVFPCVLLLSLALQAHSGQPMVDAAEARYVLHALDLRGASVFFAAFTGVLLFASGIVAGWVENWFVLHRLDSALRHNPGVSRALGARRAAALAQFMRRHISGLASNIVLGFMLGLTPPIAAFLGLGLDVRHVTLSAGQLGAACASLGPAIVREPALWWALASLPLIGAANVGVSFLFALRVALRAHNVSNPARADIHRAVWARVRRAPWSFFWPPKDAA